jgi:hypothetical protein
LGLLFDIRFCAYPPLPPILVKLGIVIFAAPDLDESARTSFAFHGERDARFYGEIQAIGRAKILKIMLDFVTNIGVDF